MHRYPEQLHLVVLGEALDLYELALLKLLIAPIQLIHSLVRLLAPGIVSRAFLFWRAVELFFLFLPPPPVKKNHKALGAIPSTHPPRQKRSPPMLDAPQHLPYVIELA